MLGKQIHRTISKLKWENFCAHPKSYSPSLVHEFYANLYDQDLEFIFVREGLLPWDANIINELYKLIVDVDEHTNFFAEVTDEKRDLLIQDLCIEGVGMIGSNPKNFRMHRRLLTLHRNIWFHFANCKLLPSTHSTTVNLDRICLIHSIIKSRKIDVGEILHHEITECAAW
ncbi:hypothetical protein PVK06_030218 [Gossypium arboreum]|uniref:Putative plant transposon protein domain-containing protein n=1 Tax=Gossypium arboreum TaxID=29729 RepID=A0ABR0NQ63_GOSAR|nr:hypothetical protein PVK06_030218 [Gossypium arboreum]